MWWCGAAAWASAEPAAELAWKPGETVLRIGAPAGEELSDDGPSRLQIGVGPGEVTWVGPGARLARGVALGAVAGDDVRVDGTVTVCNPENGYCRPIDVHFAGVIPDTRRGALTMTAAAAHAEASPYRADANAAAERAFAEAARSGRVVLLDFGAVWCPPCNLLSAEVLHAEPAPPELSAVVVAALDVDDPSSWAIKDRYAVGGYPTVVVARPDGAELGRLVGYPGRDAWLAWLANTAKRQDPVIDPNLREPGGAAPVEAAAIARSLVEAGRTADAERWLAGAADGEDLRVARFAVKPGADDARWLAEHGVPPLAWAPHGLEDPALADLLRPAVDTALVGASGPVAADLLALRAELSPEAERPVLYAAAAAALRSSFADDPALDRGYYTFLAELVAEAGDLDGAVAFLDEQTARFPDEPTFDLTAARLLNGAGRHADAAARAERALGRSWGDNHLRVAAQLAEAKAAAGDAAGAAEVARAALAKVPAPPADLAVRTPRYRTALEKFLPAE